MVAAVILSAGFLFGASNARAYNDSYCGGITAPNSVTTGQSFSASVTMVNSDPYFETSWTSDATPHNLGSQNPQDNSRWGLGRVGLPYQPVSPGSSVTFNFNATAPATAGTYPFDWRMVEDGYQWFGGTCSKTITVSAPPQTHCTRCSVVDKYKWADFYSTDSTCVSVLPAGNVVTPSCNCSCTAGSATAWAAAICSYCFPAPSCSLSVSPGTIQSGQSVTWSWSSQNDADGQLPLSCTNGDTATWAASGSTVGTPTISKTCTLTAVNTAGVSSTCSASVTVTASNPVPIGFFDAADCNQISGWTCDASNYNASIDVHFYQDGPAGSGGTMFGATNAGTYRSDLVSAGVCGGTGNHGFSYATPASLKDGKSHAIYPHPINTPSGDNPPLSPKTITCAGPCTTYSFRSGLSLLGASTVLPGGSYTMSCDYGQANLDCVMPVAPSGSCSFTGFSGTAAQFSCAAGSQTGAFTAQCKTVTGTASNCCAQTNSAGTLNVASAASSASATITSVYNGKTATANLTCYTGAVNKYRCSGGSCIQNNTNGTFTDPNCNNSCAVSGCYYCNGGSCASAGCPPCCPPECSAADGTCGNAGFQPLAQCQSSCQPPPSCTPSCSGTCYGGPCGGTGREDCRAADCSFYTRNCTMPACAFNFSLAASAGISVQKPASGSTTGSNTITATLLAGTAATVNFTSSGFPTGASGSFSTQACGPTCNTTFTVTVGSSVAAGTYPITISGTGGAVSKTASFDLVVTPSLSVTLTASTPSGPGPIDETLTATPQNATDTRYNYSFWWNCSSACNDVQSCNNACGTLPTPARGTCTNPDSIGYKCDGVTDATKQVTHTYATTGTPKVIVENGSQTALATASVTITNTPPVAYGLNVTPPTNAQFCAGSAPPYRFNWQYYDADGDAQQQSRLQVTTDTNFNNIVVNTVITGSTNEASIILAVSPGSNQLGYTTTYYWRVIVTDSKGIDATTLSYPPSSNRSSITSRPGTSFTTPTHVYPTASVVTLLPSNPHAQETVTFTAPTQPAGVTPSYKWSWPVSSSFMLASGSNTTSPTMQGKFTSSGPNQTVTLTVTDGTFNCASTASINVNVALPGWTETAP